MTDETTHAARVAHNPMPAGVPPIFYATCKCGWVGPDRAPRASDGDAVDAAAVEAHRDAAAHVIAFLDG